MNMYKEWSTYRRGFIRVLLLVLAGLMGLGQLQKIQLNDVSALYYHDFVIVAVVIVLLPFLKKTSKWAIKKKWVQWFIRFVAIVAISLSVAFIIHPFQTWIVGLLYFGRLVLYSLFCLSLISLVRERLVQRSEILGMTLASTTLIAAAGLLQYVVIPDVRGLRFTGWDDHYFRVVSTLLDPSFTGIILLIGFLISLQYLMKKKSTHIVLIAIVHFAALLLTYSRASFIALGAALIFLALQYISLRKGVFYISCLGVIGIFLLPRPASEGARLERLSSVRARVVNTVHGIQKLSPTTLLIGNGWYLTNADRQSNNTISFISHSSSPDNSFLHVLQSTGIGGLTVLGIFGFALFRSSRSLSLRTTLVAISVASWMNQVLFYPWILLILSQLIAQDEGLIT